MFFPRRLLRYVRTIVRRRKRYLTSMQRNAGSSSTFTPALEGLFTLARASFFVNKPDTYTIAHAYLSRAASLISPERTLSLSPTMTANYTRCVASAYHSIAGQLYQSGRYDHAVRFLEESSRLGQQALESYQIAKKTADSMEVDGETKGKEEAWAQLEEQLWRRWELLGVCQAKTGDRKVRLCALTTGGYLTLIIIAACLRRIP